MRQFTIGIEELRHCLARMSALVEAAIGSCVEALVTGNLTLAAEVLEREFLINELEMEIDSRAIRLIALFQPVACDLRFITATMKINTDLERMGDLAVHVTRRAVEASRNRPAEAVSGEIMKMANIVKSMVSGAIGAFLERDGTLARQIIRCDDEVDRCLRSITAQMVGSIERNPAIAATALDWMVAARSLERTADHATNIAEAALFLVSGVDVRHHASSLLTAPLPGAFAASATRSGIAEGGASVF